MGGMVAAMFDFFQDHIRSDSGPGFAAKGVRTAGSP